MIKMHDFNKYMLLALKIAVGSSAAIYIAEMLEMQFAASAGTIALLTLVTTKWETFRLSVLRLATFAVTAALAWTAFTHINHDWTAFGIFIFFIALLTCIFGLKATLSVNAVIGTHFLTAETINGAFVVNELMLIIIGIVIAIILNLFHDYRGHRRVIRANMRYAETQLQLILEEAAMYLAAENHTVWQDVRALEKKLGEFAEDAHEYQENTFHSHPQYYIDYFNMRLDQCRIIHSLHYELKKIKYVPKQAQVVSGYIMYLKEHVLEYNDPKEQLRKLECIIGDMGNEELPQDRLEFEARAMLYHILMDLEEFLKVKQRFVEKLDEAQIRRYWDSERAGMME